MFFSCFQTQTNVFSHSGIELTDQLTVKNARDLKKCTSAIQEFVLERLNQTIAGKLIDSINVLHDNYVGTLTRCLYSLESNGEEDETESSASKALQEVRRMFFQMFFCSTQIRFRFFTRLIKSTLHYQLIRMFFKF